MNQPFEYNLRFEDPERHNVSVELTGEPPAGLVFERGRVTWQPTEVGRYELLVRATDDGWPAESVDQKIVVEVSAEPPPAEPPKFDESRVAVLTGLVRTGDTWQAWINVRTRAQGNRMALAVGDKVKIGAVEGEVVEINDTQVVILSNNRRLVIRPGQSLAEAIPAS